jgi:hypothetical protein
MSGTNGNGGNGHEARPNSRDALGRFQPGCPGGPGSPLAARAVAVKSVWVEAAREKFTPAVAAEVFDRLLNIIRFGKRDRDRIGAASVLLDKLGISKDRLEELANGEPSHDYHITMNFVNQRAPYEPAPAIDPPPRQLPLPDGNSAPPAGPANQR